MGLTTTWGDDWSKWPKQWNDKTHVTYETNPPPKAATRKPGTTVAFEFSLTGPADDQIEQAIRLLARVYARHQAEGIGLRELLQLILDTHDEEFKGLIGVWLRDV